MLVLLSDSSIERPEYDQYPLSLVRISAEMVAGM
jgi:hypothetical protein